MTVLPRDIYRVLGFQVAVCSNHPDVWRGNKYITEHYLPSTVPDDAMVYQVGYDTHLSNTGQHHFMHAYVESLTGIDMFKGLRLTELRPCLFSEPEHRFSWLKQKYGGYWVICAGGKNDFLTKWWDLESWKSLGRIYTNGDMPILVQVGSTRYGCHQPLRYTVNLLDRTTEADLINIIADSSGVICGVTSVMHIAAAFNKPAVVLAGGREPWWWDSYDARMYERMLPSIPDAYRSLHNGVVPHIYLDTRLKCAGDHGCWKVGLGPGGNSCTNVVKRNKVAGPGMDLARCMYEITPSDVMQAIYRYADIDQNIHRA